MSEHTFTRRVSSGDVRERCSFCGKAANEVERLVYARRGAGVARVAICGACVARYHAWLTPAGR
jgi:ClpX C4-type zinc finger